MYSRFITSFFIIHGCYIQFQFTLVTALYYFHEIHENDPLGNTPLSENDPSKPIKILKMPPQQKPPPPHSLIKDQPPTVLPLGIQEFY